MGRGEAWHLFFLSITMMPSRIMAGLGCLDVKWDVFLGVLGTGVAEGDNCGSVVSFQSEPSVECHSLPQLISACGFELLRGVLLNYKSKLLRCFQSALQSI